MIEADHYNGGSYILTLILSHCMSTSGLFPNTNSDITVAWPTSHTTHVELESTEASRRVYGEVRV